VTPKGTKPGERSVRTDRIDPVGDISSAKRSSTSSSGGSRRDVEESSRYTPRQISKADLPSPRWVPVLMWTLLGGGALTILVNYTEFLWTQNGLVLLGGLAAILAGIMVATQYR
jgi:hypothetical protein